MTPKQPHFNSKLNIVCNRCKRVKNKFHHFYSPDDQVCIDCNSDVKFIKSLRRLVREKGLEELQIKMENYRHKIELCVEVLAEYAKDGVG